MLMYGCVSVDVYATIHEWSSALRGQQRVARRGSWPHYLRTGTLKTRNRMVRLIVEKDYYARVRNGARPVTPTPAKGTVY